MSEIKPDKLYQLSDVDQNSTIYKFFEEEFDFFNHFFSLEKYSKTFSCIENLREFINNPIFIDFQQHFETFIQNKNFKSFSTLFDLLSFLFKIRPKYLPIIILITPIALNYYSPYIKEVKSFISSQSHNTYDNFDCVIDYIENHHLATLLHKIINENHYFTESFFHGSNQKRNIKLIQTKLLQHPEYLMLGSFMSEFPPKNQELIKKFNRIYGEKPFEEIIEEIINIIIQDNYSVLIAFLSQHPEFDIHSSITIPYSYELSHLIYPESISLLDICCFFGSINCFRYFFLNSNKINAKTKEFCIIGGNYEIIQIINQLNYDFDNCLKISIIYHQYSLSDWLLSNYETEPILANDCVSNYNMKYLLFINYNTFGDYNILQNVINTSETKTNLIHKFCEIGYFPILEYFITNGCNKECQDEDGRTPLHYACREGHLPIVEYLISIGCNKECQDKYGDTPLDFACDQGYLPIVEFLIKNGCKEYQYENICNPIHHACDGGHLPTIQYLISIGCNKECKDKNGVTPLHYAILKGQLPVVEYLITIGCNKESTNKSGSTPLHYACDMVFFPIIEYLIRIGCNKDSQDKDGHTPLYLACIEKRLPIVEYLIRNGCNKECQDKDGLTPLHHVCDRGYLEIVECLIRNGCDKECQDKDGLTPLHYACRKGHLPIVQYLIRNGYNKECKDKYGSKPLDLALMNGHQNIANYIEST